MAAVKSDAIVAHRVLCEQELITGRTQPTVYMCRFLSEMLDYWSDTLLSYEER